MHIHRHLVYCTNRKERKQNRNAHHRHFIYCTNRKEICMYCMETPKKKVTAWNIWNCMNYLMLHDESNAAKKRKMIRKRKTRYYTPIGVADKERTSDKERMSEEERSRLLSVSLSGCLMWLPLYPDLLS